MNSPAPSGAGSQAGAWITGLLAAVILYVLSPGAVMLWHQSSGRVPPGWMLMPILPLEWAYDKVPLVASAYDAYFRLLGLPV
jgi:hypothetical protein